MEKNADSLKFILSIIALLAVVYLLYVPGLSGPFLFDDFPNLEPLGYFGGVSDSQSALRFIFGNSSGPTGRPLSMASFLLNDNSWPSVAFNFKQTNLLLHLACGLMALLVLNRLLADSDARITLSNSHWFCLIVIAIWVLHPINISTVLYVVQRMAILSAFFSMASLYFYLISRNRASDSNRFSQFLLLALSILFLILGVFSKENAILLVPFIIFLEVFYFDKSIFPRIQKIVKGHFWLAAIGLIVVIYLSSGWWGRGYEQRDFGLYERVSYQLPVVGDYIFKIILPKVSEFNLFNGDYESISTKGFSVGDFLRSAFTIILLLMWIASIKMRIKLVALGLSWFFIFHFLESSFYPLEMYFEHRNYLPGMGLILAAVACVDAVIKKVASDGFLRKSIFFASITYLAVSLFLLSLTWARSDTLFLKWEMDEPNSARAKVVYASLVEQQTFPENAIEHIDRAIKLKPEATGLHLRKIRLICEHGLDHDLAGAMADLAESDHFEMGVVAAMDGLIALDGDGNGQICESSGFPIALLSLFTHVESADEIAWNATRAARYYSLKSDFYARRGNLNASASSLDKAIEYTPTVDVYLKKSVMLASAGLEFDALEALENAEAADESRPAFYPSRMEEIRQLRRRVRNNNQPDLENGAFDDE
jgi:protein O-mannosyl-transferase